MTIKIKCSTCDKVVKVSGFVWRHRIRHSKQDEKGNYLGWNCDTCTDKIEHGDDCYE